MTKSTLAKLNPLTFRNQRTRLVRNTFSEGTTLTDATNSLWLSWSHNIDDFSTHTSAKSQSLYTSLGKRSIDIIISLFVIFFVLSWLVPIIAVAIRLNSKGPFYFIQLRTGYRGKPFSCYKFRTMVHTRVKSDFTQTAKNDKRVTRVGGFLRRTNLDELLQFINVLLGHMTLVGPRPHAIDHDALFWHQSKYKARYSVKPGITGLAQVKGARGTTEQHQSMNNRIRYDLIYIQNQTLALDAKIFARTCWLTMKGDPNAW